MAKIQYTPMNRKSFYLGRCHFLKSQTIQKSILLTTKYHLYIETHQQGNIQESLAQDKLNAAA